MRAVDITGVRFGRLTATVVTRDQSGVRAWTCECDCGESVVARAGQLRSGMKTSCGCLRRPSIKVGDRFGKWIVESVYKTKRLYAKVVCDCGNRSQTSASNLTTGRSTRCHKCGMRTVPRYSLPVGEAARNKVIDNYKRNAKTKGHEFLLTQEEVLTIFASRCGYCGSPPHDTTNCPRLNGDFTYTGIDRKDNRLGYTSGNSLPACKTCNFQKSDMSLEKFEHWIRRVASHRLGME